MADFTYTPVEGNPFSTEPAPRQGGGEFTYTPVEHKPEFETAAEAATRAAPHPEDEGGFAGAAIRSSQEGLLDFNRQRAAASQGTTPVLSAHEKNLVSTDVRELDNGDLVYMDDEGRMQHTDTNKHVVLHGPDGELRLYNRTPETDEHPAASLGRLLTPGMGAGKFQVGTMSAAQRIDVNVPRAISSNIPGMKMLGQFIKMAPGGGRLHEAIEGGVKELGEATGRASELAGGVADKARAGEGVRAGIGQTFKKGSQAYVSSLYDRVDSLVDPNKTAPLTHTQNEVAKIAGARQSYGDQSLGPALDMVKGAVTRAGGLTYDATKQLRTRIGEMIKQPNLLPPGTSQNELRDIYGALTKDLENAASVTGGPGAAAAWKYANSEASNRIEALKVLQKVIGPKTRSDENITNTLVRMAGTRGGDIEALSHARGALNAVAPGAWEDVASTVIGRLGRNSHDEFSPNLFIRDYNNLSPAGKAMLFHGVGAGNVTAYLDDIGKVSQKYIDAGKLANTSKSAGHAALGGLLAIAGHGIMTGSLKEPMYALGAAVGSGAVARILSSPATAASAARWTRAYDNLVQEPSARAIAQFRLASRNLGSTAASLSGDPSLAPHLIQQIQGAASQQPEVPRE